jgi:hypothetical protein
VIGALVDLFWTSVSALVWNQSDLGEDLFGGGVPDEWLGVNVRVPRVGADASDAEVEKANVPWPTACPGDDAEQDLEQLGGVGPVLSRAGLFGSPSARGRKVNARSGRAGRSS